MVAGRLILWHAIGNEAGAEFVDSAMRELLDILRDSQPPLKIGGEPLDQSDETLGIAINALNYGDLDGCVRAIQKNRKLDRSRRIGLLVHCLPTHPAAIAARKRLPHARLGISVAGSLSLAYAFDNKHLLWHEALHLLGAQDHYDRETLQPSCELPTCLMRYAPTASVIAGEHFLCQRTKAILLKACEMR